MGRRGVVGHICACLFVVLIGSVLGGSSQGSEDVKSEGSIPQSSWGERDIDEPEEILKSDVHLYVRCPIPQPPENGYMVGEVISVGAMMRVRCRDGYTLTGPEKMVCVETADGAQWSPDVIRSCLANDSSQPSLSTASLETPQGTEEMHHQEHVTEEDLHLRCPIPQPPENGYMVGEVISVGAMMRVRCRDGYTLTGPEKMVCVETKDGAQWSPDVIRSCLANDSSQPSLSTASSETPKGTEEMHVTDEGLHLRCPIPQPPENGYMVGEVIRVGAMMRVRCRDGYTLTGPEKMVCVETADGAQWSPDVIRSCLANNSSQPSLSAASLESSQGTEAKHSEKRQVISPPSFDVHSQLSAPRTHIHHQEHQEELLEPSRESTNKLPALCLYEPEVGPCRASFRRYYFKATTRECYKFIYGGCEGNTNNFETMTDCNMACLGHE